MLHFVVTADHSYTLRKYFSQWGAQLLSQVRFTYYEARPWTSEPLPGAWIFTDLERLRDAELGAARDFAGRLAGDPARWRVLNDPRRALRRYALLRDLASAGVNEFRAWRLSELPDDVRYPLFLRRENDHQGAVTPLLQDADQLRQACRSLPGKDGLLAIEYLPYGREDGLFVKFSAMRAGGELIPRHMLFSREWVLKEPDLLDEPLMLEEERFMNEFPHRQALLQIFQRAGIDYGRIDYAIASGRIQAFEINTNPTLVPPVSNIAPRRLKDQAASARQINAALGTLDVGLPAADSARVEADGRERRWRMRIHRVLQRLGVRPGTRR